LFVDSEDLITCAESGGIFIPCTGSQHALPSYMEGWRTVWHIIENIYTTAVDCGELWRDENKSRGKRRAFSELLKLLESSGLSRHQSTSREVRNLVASIYDCLDYIIYSGMLILSFFLFFSLSSPGG